MKRLLSRRFVSRNKPSVVSHLPRVLFGFFIYAILAITCLAGEIHFLALDGAGSSSVAISTDKKTAFITDGGRPGKAGLEGATLGGKAILDYLAEMHVEHLVIACSHPHSDHKGGLIALMKRPDELSKWFKSIDFVESNFKAESRSGNPSLVDNYNAAAKDLPDAQRKDLIKPKTHSSAQDELVYSYKPHSGIEVRYFGPPAGGPETAGAHGSALITQTIITEENSSTTLVDFDDASPERTSGWLSKHGAGLKKAGGIALAVIPHHGSDAEKIDAILSANFDGSIISVDPFNEYGHPGPVNLGKIIKRFGKQRVLITGAEGNIVLRPGVMPVPHADYAKVFKDFILPQRRYTELTLRKKEGKMLKAIREGDNKTAKKYISTLDDALKSLKATYDLESVYQGIPSGSSESIRYEIPHWTVLLTRLQGNNTGDWIELQMGNKIRMEHRYHRDALKEPEAMYKENENYLPTDGGVVVGGLIVKADVKPLSANWRFDSSDVDSTNTDSIYLEITTDKGIFRYDTATYTEFFAAKKLVDEGDISLVNGRYDKNKKPHFDVNPAIANTLIAFYAMQLDNFCENGGEFKIASGISVLMPQWKKLVWIDKRSRVSVLGDRLTIVANDNGSDILYRVLIKNYTDPEWLTEYNRDPLAYLRQTNSAFARLDADFTKRLEWLSILQQNIKALPADSLDKSTFAMSYDRQRKEANSLERRLLAIGESAERDIYTNYMIYSWDHATVQEVASGIINSNIESVAHEFVGLRQINAFAKTVHILRWLKSNQINLPPLNSDSIIVLNASPDLSKDDYLPQNILSLRGRNKIGGIAIEDALSRDKPILTPTPRN